MKRKSAIIALLAWLLIFPLLAQAAPVGKFTAVDGNVDVTPPGKEAVPANPGDQLNAGDIIRTKSKSKCEVTFLDGSVLRLAENSRLRVTEFSRDEGKRSATLDLFRGKIQNVVKTVAGAAADSSKYEVRTPTAVCGVRGTQFYNYYQAGVSGAVVTEGKVYAYSVNNPTEVRTVNAGQAMVVTDPNVAPTVRTATAVETEQHQKDTTPADKPKSDARKEEEQKTETAAAPTGSSPQGGGTPSSASKPEEQLPAATLATLPALAALSENISTTSAPTVQPLPTTPIVPPTAVNKTLPQVILTTTPPEKTNNTEATFIVASAETAVTYQYSLDGGAVTPAASTTITLPALPDGTHTLAVTAIDPAGNVSEPATYTWTIDTTKPTITLSGAPAGNTNATSANISVSTSEPTTFAYTLNGAPVASPNLTDLPQGTNTFTVTAADAAGNTSTESYTWTVDTTKPVITLSGVPTGLNNATSATISVSANKPVTYSYSLNGTPVTSPNLATLPEGSNTFTVTATDSAGNVSTASYTWTSDYTAPAITLSGTPASDVTRADSLNIGVSANESVTYTYSLNGTPVTHLNLTGLREGSNTFVVTATDAAGNTSAKTYTWLTDYSWTPTFTGGINEGAATPGDGPSGFGYWDFNNSQFVTVPVQDNQPSFRGSITGGRIYDTLRQEYVGDSLFKGTPPALGSAYPAASFLAEGTYDTAMAGGLFASKIMGGGPDFTVAGDGNGFITAIYGGVRTGDYLSGGVAGIYVRPEGNNTYEAGWLTSLTVDASLNAATGTWQTTGSNLLTATRMSSGLNGPPMVAQQGMNVAEIAGGGFLGTALLTPYGLANAGNPMESVTNWGIWTMAAGGTLSSSAPASSWQTLAGWQEANGEGSASYGLIRLTGTAGTGQLSGIASGWLLSPEHVVTINGSFAGAYPAGQPPADETGTWEGVGMGTFVETATDFGGSWNHSTLYNDFGWLAWNGSEEGGVFGFQKRPDGKYDFLAIGQFYDYGYGREGFGGPYLWSGALYNDNQMPNRHLEAFTGGLWQKANSGDPSGALAGHTAALYYGDGRIGLIKGDLTGAFYEMQDFDYERLGLWQAASGAGGLTSIDKTASLPQGFDVSTVYIDSNSLSAYAAGSFLSGAGENVGTLRGEYYNGKTKFITYYDYDAGYEYYEYKSLPFGIYNLKLGEGSGYNYYTGKPAGAAVPWNAKIGRDGYFGYDYGSNYGYWLADISGTWNEYSPEAGHGTINGYLSGTYLTATHMGTIGGPLYGLYTEGFETPGDGTWTGLSVGTYEGIPLKFVSNFQLSDLDWNASWASTGLYTLLGGINSLWTLEAATVGVDTTMIGRYGGNSGLWAQEYGTAIVSHNFGNATDSTYDGGSYEGYISVAIDDTRAVRTDLMGRYVAPDEGRGYLIGTLNGTAYPALGLFDGDGSVKRIPLTDPTGDWGIWQTSLNNTSIETSGPPPASFSWVEHLIDVEVDKTWWGNHQADNVQNVSNATAITTWTGSLAAARADWVSATTGVIGGHITGLYDPTASAWKAIAQGAYMETSKFLAMAADQAGRNTLAALNIPYIQVGQASLSGSGNNLTVDMNNVTFFANSVGTAPRIWATNGVSGTYTATPLIQGQTGYQAVPLSSGGGLQANFEVRNWNTAAGTWGANITGGNGTLSGGGYNGAVNFSGGAAGNIGAGTISGTAAGTVKP